MNSGYKAALQALPEPLRSQMLMGDFTAGMQDDPWQVIPTTWVELAMERWTEEKPQGAKMDCLGVDPARTDCQTRAVYSRRANGCSDLHILYKTWGANHVRYYRWGGSFYL